MAFDLAYFSHLFRHVPTLEHQLSEHHAEVDRILRQAAADVLPLLPQVQEAREFVALLDQAGKLAHAAIDKTPKVVSSESGGVTSPVSGEATGTQAVEQPEVATPPVPPAAPAEPVSQPVVHEATALPDPVHDLGTATPTA